MHRRCCCRSSTRACSSESLLLGGVLTDLSCRPHAGRRSLVRVLCSTRVRSKTRLGVPGGCGGGAVVCCRRVVRLSMGACCGRVGFLSVVGCDLSPVRHSRSARALESKCSCAHGALLACCSRGPLACCSCPLPAGPSFASTRRWSVRSLSAGPSWPSSRPSSRTGCLTQTI